MRRKKFRKPYSVSGQTELLWKATTTRKTNTTNNMTREKEIEFETLRKKEPNVDHNDDINRGIRYSSQGKHEWLITPNFNSDD